MGCRWILTWVAPEVMGGGCDLRQGVGTRRGVAGTQLEIPRYQEWAEDRCH